MALELVNSILIALAISLDCFVASFGYGLSKIKIPFRSLLVITFVTTFMLGVSILLGWLLAGLIDIEISKWISFSILLAIGLFKLFNELIKCFLSKLVKRERPVRFKLLNFRFMVKVYTDNSKADADDNKVISPIEAMLLSFILSVDQIGVGLSHGMTSSMPYILILLNILTCVFSVYLGSFIGKKVSRIIKINLSWVSGFMLIVLAVIGLFI